MLDRVLVLLKDIPDLDEIEIDPTTRKPDVSGASRRISDVDKRALEAALRLKEEYACEVASVTVGDEKTEKAILQGLAMGADSAFIVNDPDLEAIDALATSHILEAAIREIGDFDIILAGELSLDSLGSQIGPRLSRLLDIPQISYVKDVDIINGKIRAVRDLEDFDEVVESGFPVLLSVVREVNEPRIPSLMNIMKAKSKPITKWTCEELGLTAEEVNALTSVRILNVEAPVVERKKVKIEAETVDEAALKLVEVLKEEGVLG
ncbi:MAG: electron transfer flavoprotein subunit beta/FixA family protein [Candidatus Bathyarchaeia archaeon]